MFEKKRRKNTSTVMNTFSGSLRIENTRHGHSNGNKTEGFNIITVVGISNKLFPQRRPVCVNENNQQQRREHVTRSTSKCILTS